MIVKNYSCNFTLNSQNNNSLEFQFHTGFRWAVFGSAIYETVKTFHNLLLTYNTTSKDYGTIASTLSLIYLITKLADFGASTSILPFFHLFVKSKANFRKLFICFYAIPHIPLLLITAIIAPNFLLLNKALSISFSAQFALSIIVILESARSFLRLFLYTSLECKKTVFVDTSSFSIYLISLWGSHFILNVPLTIKNILIFHIIDSLATVIIFSILFYKIYYKLPNKELSLQTNIKERIFKTKIYNYLLRLSREAFTTNFLTPFFALKFGFEYAGIFYLATVIAHSLQSMLKISIGYLGNAILANLKNGEHSEKQRAFELLTQKLSTLIIPILIILFINHSKILSYPNQPELSMSTIGLALLFLTIQIIDFIVSLYEQFYSMEEASLKFLCYKIIEFILFYIFIKYSTHSNALPSILLGIISIKALSLAIISINAYSNWQIKPKFKANYYYVILSVIIALIALITF